MAAQTVLLGDICDVRDGTHDSPKPKEIGHPLVTSKHIKNYKIDFSTANLISKEDFEAVNKRSKVDKYDILISMIGTVGELALIDYEPTFAIKNIGLIKTGDELLGKYLFYYLQSTKAKQYIEASLAGSTQKFIGLGQLRKFPIELPDLETQKKIADILGTIDEKIELNRRMNETLEQMGQALFRHYFIDNPEAEKWEDGTVADLGKVITGKTPSKSKAEYYGGDVMFLKVPDMHGQSIIIKTEDMLSSLGADSQGNKYIPKWSICVSCIATVGVVSLAGRQLQTNQQINSIVPKNRSYALFNYYLLKSKSETLKTMASGGSATPNLNKGHFERIKIKVPPIELLGRFQNESENLLHTVDENTHQIQTLTTLRDTLLPRLISGKVKI